MLAWKIAPALSTGNTVILKPAPNTRLSAFLFADILKESGLPGGVVNVVSGDNEMAKAMVSDTRIDKVAFTGSTNVGKHLQKETAGRGIKLSLELGGKSPVIVYDSADLDGAVEGLVNGIFYNQGQVCCAGSRLLVQEVRVRWFRAFNCVHFYSVMTMSSDGEISNVVGSSETTIVTNTTLPLPPPPHNQNIYEKFIEKVKRRMSTLRVGSSLEKNIDMAALIDETQKKRIQEFVEIGREEGADVYQPTEVRKRDERQHKLNITFIN